MKESLVKQLIRNIIRAAGFEVRRLNSVPGAGSEHRPIGRMDLLLEDLKARKLQCSSILDVGANNAQWSEMAARIFPDAKFTLLEPQEEMADSLDAFCKRHRGSRFLLNGAGAVSGDETLTIWEDFAGSSLLPSADKQLLQSGKQRKVKIITIDSLLETRQLEMPDLIKLDIQGFELEALKGAEKTFGSTEAYILEVSLFPFDDVPGVPVFSEVINFMFDRGYVVYDFPGFLRRPYDGALGQCDVCFVNRNGFLRKSNLWQ